MWKRMGQQQHQFGTIEIPTAIAIAAAAAATVASATGAIVSSQQAAATADYNEGLANQQAELARRAGKAAEADTRAEAARVMALQRAQLGDSGVTTEGTPLLQLLDTAEQAEVEAQRARYSGQVAEHGALANAGLFRMQSGQARVAGAFGAGTSLLTGASNVAGIYARGARGTGAGYL